MATKDLFNFGKIYLCEQKGVDPSVLEYYLTLWKYRRPANLLELCRNMIDHARNRRNMSDVIGEIDNIAKFLFQFDPKAITRQYSDWDSLFDLIKRNYTPPGPMDKDNPHGYWRIFCKSIISIASYLSRFKSLDDFNNYTRAFDSDKPDIRLSLPLILKEEIFGFQFALACDFIKENVSPLYIKPDTHIRYVFSETGLCQKGDSDFNIFRKGIKYCEEIDELPYAVDRLFWLIGSGKLFKTIDRPRDVFIKTNREEFVKKFKKN